MNLLDSSWDLVPDSLWQGSHRLPVQGSPLDLGPLQQGASWVGVREGSHTEVGSLCQLLKMQLDRHEDRTGLKPSSRGGAE